MRKNIFLIQSLGKLDQPSGFMRTCSLEPLALEYLESSVEEIGFNPELFFGKIDIEDLLLQIEKQRPFAVCFSVYTYQYIFSLEIADRIKNLAKKLDYSPYIIFGGYHPTALPDETILNQSVDFVVIGEGEKTLQELIICLANRSELSRVKGILYEQSGQIIKTEVRERIKDIDDIPLPKRHLSILANTGQYQITYPPPSMQVNVAQVAYSRGCPFSCNFCSSENTWGKNVIWRDPIKVLDEIEMLHEKYGTNLIYFPDLTFNVNEKKVFEICDEFKKRNLPVWWWGLFRLDRLSKDMLIALKEAKCVKLSIGVETVDDDIAHNVKGDYSLVKEDYLEILRYADEIGLIIKAFLIVGFLHDTKDKILGYLEGLFELPLDEIRVTFITPFPGTKIWRDYKENYIDFKMTNWENFTTEEPIILHPSLSNKELIDLRHQLVRDFYLNPKYLEHIANKICSHPNLRDSYLEYLKFLQVKDIFNNNSFDYELLLSKINSEILV